MSRGSLLLLLTVCSLWSYLVQFNVHAQGTHESVLGNYSQAAVSVDGEPCAKIAMDVIRQGGYAADAAIAGLLCNGLSTSMSMGLGGGFIMTIYKRDTMTAETLIAREMAPSYAHQDMFEDNPTGPSLGPLAIAVPGEVMGYWELKQKYGNPDVTWESLFQPAIDMCRNGIRVSWSLADSLQAKKEYILNDPGLNATFVNPETGDLWLEGDYHTRNTLADTLERIALNGPDEFYQDGQTGEMLIHDIFVAGGLMAIEDFKAYQTVWSEPVAVNISNKYTVYGVPPPASGVIMGYILNILQNYDVTPADGDPAVWYQRMVEAFKWAYGERTKLGDPVDPDITDLIDEMVANMTSESFAYDTFTRIDDFSTVNDPYYYGAEYSTSENHGTAHLSLIAPNGDAISVTSTINQLFGCKILSPSTGIILNDEMDDFSYPGVTNEFGVEPSPNNFVKPGKRPLSSMSPTIVVDSNGDVRSVTGAAGGTKITTATAITLMRTLWQGYDVKTALDTPRVHHQLTPMAVLHEVEQRQEVLDYLRSVGHNTSAILDPPEGGVVCGLDVSPEDGQIYANADKRKAGAVDGF